MLVPSHWTTFPAHKTQVYMAYEIIVGDNTYVSSSKKFSILRLKFSYILLLKGQRVPSNEFNCHRSYT